MRYIVVIELESVGFTSCKIQGLPSKEVTSLDSLVKSLNLPSNKQNESFYEVDTPAFRMINILADGAYGASRVKMHNIYYENYALQSMQSINGNREIYDWQSGYTDPKDSLDNGLWSLRRKIN